MSFDAEAAIERAVHTIEASQVLAAKAMDIAHACREATTEDVVVAVVDADMSFGGAWIIPNQNIMPWEDRLEEGAWSLLFAPRTRVEEVVAQCANLEEMARRRWAMLKRWQSRPALG
ncbi:MAG: hypothetical protein KIT87_23560 [Anaerolineae bacterium]|nr:hypothetical protein [Anaerolineae bacterium]